MKQELEDIIKGRNWSNLYDFLWVAATVRYTTYQQLKSAFPDELWRTRFATPDQITRLAGKGYLNLTEEGVITVTSKALDFLKTYSTKNIDIIKLPRGQGKKESLTRAEVFLRIIKEHKPYALFYPEFKKNPKDTKSFLVPDGAVVLKKENQAKLVFLEVESEKPNWQDHLEGKKYKYELLAQDVRTWSNWWRHWCKRLHLRHCSVEEFGFTVWCFGEWMADWEGWEFINE